MKKRSTLWTIIIVSIISIGLGQQKDLPVDQQSKVWLEGTSTLHDFTCTVSQFMGSVSVNRGISPEELSNVKIVIPVANIKSGKEAMDENLQEALNAEDHPEIVYQLVSIQNVKTEGKTSTLHTEGMLTINGKTKVVPMTVVGKPIGDGKMQIDGSKKILMTDFGVTPPTMFLGTVKTGNEITVRFSIVIAMHGTEVSVK